MGISHMPSVHFVYFETILLRKISQYEFSEIDTFIGGGHLPAGLF